MRITKNGVTEPSVMVLSTVGGKMLGAIPNIRDDSVNIRLALKDASEVSFDVYRVHDDTDYLWNSITDFKLVWVRDCNMVFQISVSVDEGTDTIKHVTGRSLGHCELSQILLRNIEVNTEEDILRDDYSPTVLYSEDKSASLMDRLLEKAPHYSIGHVDDTIHGIQRSFDFNKTSIADAFDDIAEEIGCLFEYSTTFATDPATGSMQLLRVINAYDMQNLCLDCGARTEGEVCSKCGSENLRHGYGSDTGVFVSVDNLSDQIQYSVDVDSVKNCFALEAGDELMTAVIRSTLPSGDGYLWYLNEATRSDMSDELNAKLNEYDALYAAKQKTEAYQIDASAFNLLVYKYPGAEGVQRIFPGRRTQSGGATRVPEPPQLDEPGIYLNGLSNVLAAYYNASAMGTYLKTTMMPEVTITGTTAQEEINKLTGLTAIALSEIKPTTSAATLETAIKSLVKMYIKSSAYNVSVTTAAGGWDPTAVPAVWTGTITLTAWADSTDTATLTGKTLTVSDDLATYLTEALNKELSAGEDYSIVGLFNSDSFVDELKRYSADSLDSFYQIATACVNILIEFGCGDSDHDLHQSMYLPWYEKLGQIQAELDVRGAELQTVTQTATELQGIIDGVHDALNMHGFLGDALYAELAAFRREDTYSNDNYISDGLTDMQLIENANAFIDAAQNEIYKSANLQHKITATMYNLLLIPEFEPLLDRFEIGNWIMLRVDDRIYRLRLLRVGVAYGSLDKITVEFSDTLRIRSGMTDIRSVLASASSMATSFGAVTRQAEKGSAASGVVDDWVSDGLKLTSTRLIDSPSDTKMTIDRNGILLRGYDSLTDTPTDEQVRITNRTIAFTDDNWETSRTAIGRFEYVDPNTLEQKTGYGVIADTVVANAITADKIAAGAITTDKIDAGAITADKIDAGAVTTEKLDAGAVTADKINAGAVTTDKIDAGAITSDKINAGAITADKIDAGAVTTDKINAGAITADKIEAGAIKIDKLEADMITTVTTTDGEKTKIKGGVIDTESLFAQNIKATERFEVENDSYLLRQDDTGFEFVSAKEYEAMDGYHTMHPAIKMRIGWGLSDTYTETGQFLLSVLTHDGMGRLSTSCIEITDELVLRCGGTYMRLGDENGVFIDPKENTSNEKLIVLNGDVWIKDHMVSDYIIERSTSDIWQVTKWASGRMECIGVYSFTALPCTTAYGNGGWYRTADIWAPDYPADSAFIEIPTVNIVWRPPTDSLTMIPVRSSVGTTTRPPKVQLIRPVTLNSAGGKLEITAVGRWK